MRQTVQRIRNRAGESLIETITALMIAALSAITLAGAIFTSSVSAESGKDWISRYCGQNEKGAGVVRQETDGVTGTVVIQDTGIMPELSEQNCTVSFFRNTADPETPVVAYH